MEVLLFLGISLVIGFFRFLKKEQSNSPHKGLTDVLPQNDGEKKYAFKQGYFQPENPQKYDGIEPVSAPFDLGCAVATTPTLPLLAEGVTCGVQFHAGKVWTTHYMIEVEPLATT